MLLCGWLRSRNNSNVLSLLHKRNCYLRQPELLLIRTVQRLRGLYLYLNSTFSGKEHMQESGASGGSSGKDSCRPTEWL